MYNLSLFMIGFFIDFTIISLILIFMIKIHDNPNFFSIGKTIAILIITAFGVGIATTLMLHGYYNLLK